MSVSIEGIGQKVSSVDDSSTVGLVGYGRSDTVDIPEDWSVKTISEVAAVRTGPFGSALHERDYVDDGTPIVTVEHLSERGIVHENLPLVSDSDRSRLAAYRLQTGDIVFSRVGSIDRNSLIGEEEDGWLFSGRLLRVRTLDDTTHPPYLSYHFQSEPFKRRVRSVAVGQTMASLNTQILNNVCVILPAAQEQRAIAEALSDADNLLGALGALITKKRDMKWAAMQQLLTGKTRLPGFSGKWEAKRISHIADVDPENLSSETHGNFTFNYISLEQVDAGILLGYSELVFRKAPSRARRILRHGDVLMSTVRPNLMSHLLYNEQVPNAVCSTGFAVLRAKRGLSDPAFLFAHLFGPFVTKQIDQTLVGSNYPAINSHEVGSLQIPCPPEVHEQSAISAVLSDMDSEIAALERRRDKTRAIKSGMMQELLTGRIRLVEAGG